MLKGKESSRLVSRVLDFVQIDGGSMCQVGEGGRRNTYDEKSRIML